jgi:hypothetical protein
MSRGDYGAKHDPRGHCAGIYTRLSVLVHILRDPFTVFAGIFGLDLNTCDCVKASGCRLGNHWRGERRTERDTRKKTGNFHENLLVDGFSGLAGTTSTTSSLRTELLDWGNSQTIQQIGWKRYVFLSLWPALNYGVVG